LQEFPKYVVDATALTSLDLSNNPIKAVRTGPQFSVDRAIILTEIDLAGH